jgi:hypothetical protein
VLAQQPALFVPVNQQLAIEKGTRTIKGVPGDKYFQNSTDYDIRISFDPAKSMLTGSEQLTYYNNSPDTLKQIYIRLYQNLFKPETLRQVAVDPSDFHSGVQIKRLTISGMDVPAEKFKYSGTNLIVPIQAKLPPFNSLKLEIDWSTDLPDKTQLRMGRYDSTSYFVAYFYPQIAVYDDLSGWCTESFNGLQEFYNDYGNFTLRLSLPPGYVAWATGVLQNSAELFSADVQQRILQAAASDSVTRVITAADYANDNVLKGKTTNTWIFKAINVSDIAFGVSNHYVWDAASLIVDSVSGRRAVINAVYSSKSKTGEGVAAIGRQTIFRLSTDLMGIPYPYPHNTVWEGDGGMEFPMMCNNGPTEDLFSKVFVTSHEMAHSYFPFMVGTNETHFAWIDEGLITFIPKEIEKEYGNPNAHYYISSYGRNAMGKIYDVPLSVPSTQLSHYYYMMQNYGRAACGFYFLHDMLGPAMFRQLIQEFILRWESKHPTPTDLFYTLNSVTASDWSWYWSPWFYEYGYAELALEQVAFKKNKLRLTVRKIGSYPVPVKLKVTFDDNSTETIYQSAIVWKNSDTWTFSQTYTKTVIKVELGDRNIPDAFPKNNRVSL